MLAAFTFPAEREDEVALIKALSGGALMDVGCYCVNVMRYFTGEEPDGVHAAAIWGEQSQVDETLAGILKFPSGAIGHFDCGLRAHTSHFYEIRGTKGRIAVDEGFDIEPDHETTIHFWHGDHAETIRIPPANHFTLMIENFAAAILSGSGPRFQPNDAVQNMRVIDNLYARL